jgi:(3R)-3-hydroxyacyl-CoA dehydrogenase / 3a,7a,12a-trihydroxy-5b-cholest-24-enoyl-CoA hydratase / enoyl-CoA hydratase 2
MNDMPGFCRIARTAIANIFSRSVNKDLVGQSVKRLIGMPDRQIAADFAHATRDPFFAEHSDYIPLFISARFTHPLFLDILTRRGSTVNLFNIVHAESEFIFYHPVTALSEIVCHVTLQSVEQTPAGEMIVFSSSLSDADNLLLERRDGFIVRTSKKSSVRASEVLSGTIIAEIETHKGQSREYARASLDANYIHTSGLFARLMGFKGVILHGLCTMSLASHAIIRGSAYNDPKRLKRMSVRFSKPVYPGERLYLVRNISENSALHFEVHNSKGMPVIRNGHAEVI